MATWTIGVRFVYPVCGIVVRFAFRQYEPPECVLIAQRGQAARVSRVNSRPSTRMFFLVRWDKFVRQHKNAFFSVRKVYFMSTNRCLIPPRESLSSEIRFQRGPKMIRRCQPIWLVMFPPTWACGFVFAWRHDMTIAKLQEPCWTVLYVNTTKCSSHWPLLTEQFEDTNCSVNKSPISILILPFA